MANKISENTMKAIEVHLDCDIRAAIHFLYSPCSPEKFLREYYLMVCFERGPIAALELDLMLYHEFGIDIEDIVPKSERDKEYEEGGWF